MSFFKVKQLVEAAPQREIIVKPAMGNHNEVTVCIQQYKLNVFNIVESLDFESICAIEHTLNQVYPTANIQVAGNSSLPPAVYFTVKAKTERRKDDVHNQKLAEDIVIAKAGIKAASIAKRIIDTIYSITEKNLGNLEEATMLLEHHIEREKEFVSKF
jgi:hypothetical protein